MILLLDSEAISALAHRKPKARYEATRALIWRARKFEHEVATSAAILAEVMRGRPSDSAVFAMLRRERVKVHPVDTAVGVRAGQLLGAVRSGSEMAIDAFIVATGDLAGGALVATVDPDDLGRLAGHAARVEVANIG